MNLVYELVVVTHLLGMAAVVGGYLSVRSAPRVTDVMLWGARAQIVTGLVLVGLAEGVSSLDRDLDRTKIAVKLVVALAVAGVAEASHARAKRAAATAAAGTSGSAGSSRGARTAGASADVAPALAHLCGLLAVVNVVVAAAWG